MPRAASARRHAQAVFQLALERGELDPWQEDLSLLSQVLEVLLPVLETPRIPFSRKRELLEENLKGVNPLALNLALLLVAKGRLKLVPDLVAEFNRMVDRHRGIERAEVITAVPLEPEEEERMARSLSSLVRKAVRVEPRVDPSILGGVVARIGDRLLDASIRSQLQALKRSMTQGSLG